MDSLKTIAEKVKRSPQVIRKKLASPYDKMRLNKHEELREDWLHQPEPLNDGVPFYVKWLGTRQVSKAQGSGCTDSAVKKIVEEAKKAKKPKDECRLQKVLLTISTKNVTIEDMETKEIKLEVPIYRVSYCTADPNFPKVFAFITREHNARNLCCHALLCSKDSMAQAISLTVADAFTVAYDSVQNINQAKQQKILQDMESREGSSKPTPLGYAADNAFGDELNLQSSPAHTGNPFDHISEPDETSCIGDDTHVSLGNPFKPEESSSTSTGHLLGNPFVHQEVTSSIEFIDTPTPSSAPFIQITDDEHEAGGIVNSAHESLQRMKALDLAVDDDFDAAFTRLAEARSSTNLFETPVRRKDFQDDVRTLLATEQTAKDLMMSRSHEDLFM